MQQKATITVLACLLTLGLLTQAHGADQSALVKALASGGHVLMIRHAYAPGGGDPANFQLGDCTTQRNLNAEGREQARRIGRWLKERGVTSARVYSSQWCRCLDTATGIDLGPVTELRALNSFFQRPQEGQRRLKALREFLADQPTDGELILLVTHYVTIAGLTGETVSSGEAVVLQLQDDGSWVSRGRMNFGP